MRLAFAFSILLIHASAFACPEISGTYKCDTRKQPLKITQSTAHGITTYVVHGDIRIADKKVHDLPDSPLLVHQQYKASCTAETFTVKQTAKNRDGAGKLDMQIDMFYSGKNFIYSITGFYNPVDGKPVPIDEYITCVPIAAE